MHSSRPRAIDSTKSLTSAVTVETAAATYVGSVECDGYNHVDFVVVLPVFGANTTLTALWQEAQRNFLGGTVDVEDVNLTLGTAPKIQYQSIQTLTGGVFRYSFRVRTQGAKVALYLQLDSADLADVEVTYTRG